MIKKIIIIAIAAIIMPSALLLSALIPKDAIKSNMLKSAEYLNRHDMFGCVIDGVEGSRIDDYADSILLNIAYHLDRQYPFRSVALSAYYFSPDHEENENLLTGVRDDPGMNRQYLRYWHGSIAYLRPLFLIMSLQGIFVINACILIILFAIYVVLLVRMKDYAPVTAMVVALVMARVWFVPLSLEYTWTIMLMLAYSVAVIILYRKGMKPYYGLMFVLAGMMTAFVDFLTVETVPLLVPLLLVIWLSRNEYGSAKEIYGVTFRYIVYYGTAYALMWSSKWLFTSIVMQENAMPYVLGHVEERIGGDLGLGTWQYITGAVTRNIGCLFPLGYGALGVVAFTVILIYACYRAYVYRREKANRQLLTVMTVIGLIPYVRFSVLHNHSYLHCFFTYRAQITTVMAVVLMIALISEKRNTA